MSIKSVLVLLDTADDPSARIETAIGLAREHGAHLAALHVMPRIEIPGVTQAYLDTEIIAAQERATREAAAKIEATFNDRARREGIRAEWRLEKGDVYEIAALHARYADLAVVGQTPPEGPIGRLFLEIPEQLVMTSGRPVIVVPYVGSYPWVGRHVMVAWNGTRESARAVGDALPLLERAERVTVVGANPSSQSTIPGSDIGTHLAHHGIEVEVSELHGDDIDIGDMLLSRAADLSIDLIVMGAYGHSRAREWAVGGVTRHMLKHMTVPVFMSH